MRRALWWRARPRIGTGMKETSCGMCSFIVSRWRRWWGYWSICKRASCRLLPWWSSRYTAKPQRRRRENHEIHEKGGICPRITRIDANEEDDGRQDNTGQDNFG